MRVIDIAAAPEECPREEEPADVEGPDLEARRERTGED